LNGLLEILPEYILYGFYAVVAGLVFLIALSFWKNIAPAAPGIPLGYYEVIGRYAGGSLMKRIQGTLVDSTQIFLSPENQQRFKKFIIDRMDVALKKGNPANAAEIRQLKMRLKAFPFQRACRIIVTRDRFFRKHILVQWRYVDKPLTEYAVYEDRGKFTFSAGLISRGVITGTIKTLPEPLVLPKLGKFHVHLFLPDVPRNEKPSEPPLWLAKIPLFMPSVAEVTELIESKDEQISELTRQLREMGKQVAASSTTRDAFWRILAVFSTEGKTSEMEKALGGGFDAVDAVLVGGPIALAAYIANYFGYEWFYGAAAGLAVGYYLYRRRRSGGL